MKTTVRAVYVFACALPIIFFCTACGNLMLPIALAVSLHEVAHLAVLRLLSGRIVGFSPAPFGLCIEYDSSSLSLFGEALVCGAGCLANLLLAVISCLLYRFFGVQTVDFCIVNLALCFVNLIPARKLDGGKLLEILLELFFNERVSYVICLAVDYAILFFVFLFASYSLLTAQSGLYPLLFSVYLFVCNAKNIEKSLFNEKVSI